MTCRQIINNEIKSCIVRHESVYHLFINETERDINFVTRLRIPITLALNFDKTCFGGEGGDWRFFLCCGYVYTD